jgi:hypothetical protein
MVFLAIDTFLFVMLNHSKRRPHPHSEYVLPPRRPDYFIIERFLLLKCVAGKKYSLLFFYPFFEYFKNINFK